MMNLYEFTYTKTVGNVTEQYQWQTPAENELQAAVILGQAYPDHWEFQYDEVVIKIISIKKVG